MATLIIVCAVPILSISVINLAYSSETARRPNIVLILADDLGYGDPGCFNAKSKILTPNLDRLAAEGMRFTDEHSAGALCTPTRYGLMTGRYPQRTTLEPARSPCIEEGRMTVASLLADRGYQTAMIGKWHLGFDKQGWDKPFGGGPVDRGFASFFGIPLSTDLPDYYYIEGDRVVAAPSLPIAEHHSPGWSKVQGEFWRAGKIAPGMQLSEVLPNFTDRAVQIIGEAKRQQPLFLYLAFSSPHTPWLPSAEFKGRSEASMYGDFTMMVDQAVGRVLKALEQAGMADDTLVMFTSDNGPQWDPADIERLGHDSAGGWRGKKGQPYEGGHRMPFIARWPGKVKAGSASRQLMSHCDVMATLAAITGSELPRDAGEDSFNLLPVLLGLQSEDQPIRETLMLSTGRTIFVRQGPWKLLQTQGKIKPGEAAGELYNLADDPAEAKDLYAQHPEIVERLTQLKDRLVSTGRSRP
ncbi:MAG TPA: arylsulfatase [Pirellulales bacterium]|nr:arylsulfatase [Pirellulales bacterium]